MHLVLIIALYNYILNHAKDFFMKHLMLLLLIGITSLFAEVTHRYIDEKLLDSGIKIVDIRTPGEWKETGLVKGSIPIVFFDERGNYDVNAFMKELNAKVDTKKRFALICNSGNRTRIVSDFLSRNFGYDVIDLQGGIQYAISKKMPLEPYRGK
jgi:rhodanese-related sulfurtransferase